MERVEVDPVLRDFGWNPERIGKMLSDRDRYHRMNRTESKIYNLELEVMRSKRWARMKAKVDIGIPNPRDPAPRLVRLMKRSRENWGARAGEYLEWNSASLSRNRRSLKELIAHELIHYYLMDNGCHKGTRKREYAENAYHGRLFRECAGILINSRENPKVYRYTCSCGHWIELPGKKREGFMCRGCGKRMVPAIEYRSLKKISQIRSKIAPIDLSRYALATIKRKA